VRGSLRKVAKRLPATWQARLGRRLYGWENALHPATVQATELIAGVDDLDLILRGRTPHKSGAFRVVFNTPTGHTWLELMTLEAVLDAASPETVIELGTANGHFTMYLATWARLNGAKLATVDRDMQWIDRRVLRELDRWRFPVIIGDCFEAATIAKVTRLIRRPGRTLLICDNGDKEREVQVYGGLLKPDDIIVVDDWGDEVDPARASEALSDLGFAPYAEPLLSGTWQRAFRRTQVSPSRIP
jgi:hypothetical protein